MFWRSPGLVQASPVEVRPRTVTVSRRPTRARVPSRAPVVATSRHLSLASGTNNPLPPYLPAQQLVLDKESFTLEELLEEDDVIQECKSLNSRLIDL